MTKLTIVQITIVKLHLITNEKIRIFSQTYKRLTNTRFLTQTHIHQKPYKKPIIMLYYLMLKDFFLLK